MTQTSTLLPSPIGLQDMPKKNKDRDLANHKKVKEERAKEAAESQEAAEREQKVRAVWNV